MFLLTNYSINIKQSSSSILYKHQLLTRYLRDVFRILSKSHKISSFIHFSLHFFFFCHFLIHITSSQDDRFLIVLIFLKFSRFFLTLLCFLSDQFEILWTKTFQNKLRKSVFRFAIFYERIINLIILYLLILKTLSRIWSKVKTYQSHSNREKLVLRNL